MKKHEFTTNYTEIDKNRLLYSEHTLDYYRIEKALQYIYDNAKKQPSLSEISEQIGINEYDLQKTFKRWAGVSPKKFLQYLTLEHAKKIIKTGSIEDATYHSGLSSTSRLHDLFINIESVTPSEYKTHGTNIVIAYGFHPTKFGELLIGITLKGIVYLGFVLLTHTESLSQLKKAWPNSIFIEDNNATLPYIQQIFDTKTGKLNILLKGTNFQIKVWKALLEIPEGSLSTYKNIAEIINHPKALQAVGTAVGNNPIAYLIPCHRVINSLGKIGNYSGGKYRKHAILGWEMARALSN